MLAQPSTYPTDSAYPLLALGERWPEPNATRVRSVREADLVDVLGDDALGRRFRNWRGRSGRRYIFSVFDPANCPAYSDAVLIDVTVDADGRQQALAIEDAGSFPEMMMSALSRNTTPGQRREIHVHLLARTAADRRALVADLQASG